MLLPCILEMRSTPPQCGQTGPSGQTALPGGVGGFLVVEVLGGKNGWSLACSCRINIGNSHGKSSIILGLYS